MTREELESRHRCAIYRAIGDRYGDDLWGRIAEEIHNETLDIVIEALREGDFLSQTGQFSAIRALKIGSKP